MLVSDKYKLMYKEIPRVASTTMYKFWNEVHGGTFFKDSLTRLDERKYVLDNFLITVDQWEKRDSYFKLAIVRNPFSRIVSAYNFRIKNLHLWNPDKRFDPTYPYSHRELIDKMGGNSFDNFVNYIVNIEPEIYRPDWHWMPQSTILKLERKVDPNFFYNQIVKLENFDEIYYCLKKLNINYQFDVKNRTYGAIDITKSERLIRKYYQEDFRMFNYE